MAVPMYFIGTFKKDYYKAITFIFQTRLIKNVLYTWLLLIVMSIVYPVVFMTLDFSFFIIVFLQLFHLLAAVPFFAYIYLCDFTRHEIENSFVGIFVIQTIIQIIVFSSPTLGELIIQFNHFDTNLAEAGGLGSKVRGKALSAATTYHLSLAYGICFIIFIKEILSKRVSILNVLIGFFVFVGIFFAGRTGFVGCIIGLFGYFIYKEKKQSKFIFLFKVVATILFILFLVSFLLMQYAPDLYDDITKNVLPYAFEFIDNMDQSGSMETRSTNRLKEMWSEEFNLIELIIGSGNFSNNDGSFYMHVDPGILRIPLFSGILGYFLVWLYQIKLFPLMKFKGRNKYYSLLIILYLAIMDFKAVTIGLNKFAFSITLLLSFIYLYLPDNSNAIKKGKNWL